jgi:hypothetical protein
MLLEDPSNNYYRDIKDTVIWAKLSIGDMTARQARGEIDLLIQDSNTTAQWKSYLEKRILR